MTHDGTSLSKLEDVLGHVFTDRSLLWNALIHSSYLNENPSTDGTSNERLEFLGDAVLGQVVATHLYRAMPDSPEGDLTRLRAALVRRETLADVAMSIDLGSYLVLGKGEEASGGKERPASLADAFEAVLGAVYLDQGERAARGVVERLVLPLLGKIMRGGEPVSDAKSRLQERLQAAHKTTPVYRLVAEHGPDHEPRFTVEVLLNNQVLGRGAGLSKRAAEQEAASAALILLNDDPAASPS